MTLNPHDPTPEFTRHLEWQVETAMRRQTRFAEPVHDGYGRYLKIAATILVSVFIGAASVAASGRIQEGQNTQVLVQQHQGDLTLAQLQLKIAEKAVQDARKKASVGLTTSEATAEAQRDLQEAMLRVERVQLDLEEVRRSGKPVQNDITAPVVDGKDFVLERLTLEERSAAMAAEMVMRALKDAKTRNDVGLTSEMELMQAEANVRRAMNDVRDVREKMDVRRQFLEKKLSPEQATRQRLLLVTRNQLETAETELAVSQQRYAYLQKQFKVGLIPELDLLNAQLEMLSTKKDVDTLRTKLQTLEGGF